MAIFLGDLVFTINGDFVNGSSLIVANGSSVDTLAGDDRLYGLAGDVYYSANNGTGYFGVYLEADLSLADGADELVGTASFADGVDACSYVSGVNLGFDGYQVVLDTGFGRDLIKGVATATSGLANMVSGIFLGSNSALYARDGGDSVIGQANGVAAAAIAGIHLEAGGLIDLGIGNDLVTGTVDVTGAMLSYGIGAGKGGENNQILAGAGNDAVIARTRLNGIRANGFFGGIKVDLGPGRDSLEGFGELTAIGGAGRDLWDLTGYQSTDFAITPIDSTIAKATFTRFGVTATVQEFESFIFDNGTFTYAQLFG